jgi:hypothetical protein
MNLRSALGVGSADDIDAERPIVLGNLELSVGATAEAIRILQAEQYLCDFDIRRRTFNKPRYWSVEHQTDGSGEIFGFPEQSTQDLPTAIEIAIVRAVSATSPALHPQILGGGYEIYLGPDRALTDFRKILDIVSKPLAGSSLLYDGANQAIVSECASERLKIVSLGCLKNSFHTAPIKYRFLEIYRIMENLFINNIKRKLIEDFDSEPSASLSDAADALKSEITQLCKLAEQHEACFEKCLSVLKELKGSNRFVAALFRRVSQKKWNSNGQCATGAAMIYQIRCSIVHAGTKDMIYENFDDSEAAVETVLPHVERAALLLLGVALN